MKQSRGEGEGEGEKPEVGVPDVLFESMRLRSGRVSRETVRRQGYMVGLGETARRCSGRVIGLSEIVLILAGGCRGITWGETALTLALV